MKQINCTDTRTMQVNIKATQGKAPATLGEGFRPKNHMADYEKKMIHRSPSPLARPGWYLKWAPHHGGRSPILKMASGDTTLKSYLRRSDGRYK
jgi:hypothetical protein